ncbi:hypothetical protein ACN4DZ_10735 [Corynebacterium macclintockiae]
MAEIQNMRAPEKRSLITMAKTAPKFWFPVYAIGWAYLIAWILLDFRFLSFQDTKSASYLLLALAALACWAWTRVKANEKYNVQLQQQTESTRLAVTQEFKALQDAIPRYTREKQAAIQAFQNANADDLFPANLASPKRMAAVIAYIENHRANTVSDALNLYIFEQRQKQQTEELRAHNAAMRQEQAAHNAAIRRQQQQAHQLALYNQTMDNMLARQSIDDALRGR